MTATHRLTPVGVTGLARLAPYGGRRDHLCLAGGRDGSVLGRQRIRPARGRAPGCDAGRGHRIDERPGGDGRRTPARSRPTGTPVLGAERLVGELGTARQARPARRTWWRAAPRGISGRDIHSSVGYTSPCAPAARSHAGQRFIRTARRWHDHRSPLAGQRERSDGYGGRRRTRWTLLCPACRRGDPLLGQQRLRTAGRRLHHRASPQRPSVAWTRRSRSWRDRFTPACCAATARPAAGATTSGASSATAQGPTASRRSP